MTTLHIAAGVIGLLVIGGMAWIAYRDHQRRVLEDVREAWDWPDDEDDEPMPACPECGDEHTPACDSEDEYL